MSGAWSRRRVLTTGLTVAASATGLAAAVKIADRYGLIPPDSGGIWGPGETLTYATQRLLMARHSMAREFTRSEISKVIPVSGPQPKTDPYQRLLRGDFADWRLSVDGLVARPSTFSLDEIKRMPAQRQITHQACEEGWSFIAEWTGVPLSYVLNLVGMSPAAKFVVFTPFDGVVGQPRSAGRAPSANAARVQRQRQGFASRSRCASSGARGATAWLQEREVSGKRSRSSIH